MSAGRWGLVAGLLLLAGCYAGSSDAPPGFAARPVTRQDGSVVQPVATVAPQMRSIDLDRVQVSVPRGSVIGSIEPMPLVVCVGRRPGTITYDGGRYNAQSAEWNDVFFSVMSGHGYRLNRAPGDLFADSQHRTAEFLVGANITEIHVDGTLLCDFINAQARGVNGRSSIAVDWQIFDPVRQQVVYRQTVQGRYVSDRVLPVDPFLMVQLAFADAVNQLAADPAARAAVSGGAPAVPAVAQDRPRRALPRRPLSQRPIDEIGEAVRAATVLVEVGAGGHGSGFIVSADGLMLTNAHVVGGQHFVRVRLLSGRAVVGEVLQVDGRRDVALVRLEGADWPALPVRETPVRVAEPVYAIGAPQMKELAWTVTRGVVSAYRQTRPPEQLDYIQADVPVHGGNSGGPLLDRNGNVVGICVAGLAMGPDKTNAGLNLFIPILDGLDRLGLDLGGPAPAQAAAVLRQ